MHIEVAKKITIASKRLKMEKKMRFRLKMDVRIVALRSLLFSHTLYFPPPYVFLPVYVLYISECCNFQLCYSSQVSFHPHLILFPLMTTCGANKRPCDEDSEPLVYDSSDSEEILEFSADDDPLTKGKKRSKLEPSNTDIVRSTALHKLQIAPRGSFGIPAVQALLAKLGSVSTFTAASRETNSGLQKSSQAVSGSGACKSLNVKGKERRARYLSSFSFMYDEPKRME